MFFYGFLLGGMQLIMLQLSSHFGLDIAGMGLLVSSQHISALIMPVICGNIADRIGKKPVLLVCVGVFAVGCALAAISPGIGLYLVSAALMGTGYSVSESLCSAALNDIDQQAGVRYINLSQCLLSVGAMLAPQIYRLLQTSINANWRAIFAICAAGYFVLFFPLLKTKFPPSVEIIKTNTKKSNSKLLMSPIFLCLFFSIVLYVGLENGFGYFAQPYFETELGHEQLGAYAISAYWLGMAASRLLSSIMLKRDRLILCICFAVTAVLFAVLALNTVAYISVVVCGIVGVVFGPIWSTLVAKAAGAFPTRAASAVGMMTAGCGLGAIIYPSLTGFLAKNFSIKNSFLFLSLSAIVALALCLVYCKLKKEDD